MAEHDNNPMEAIITFDIFDGKELTEEDIFNTGISQDEVQEIANVVQAMDGVNSREIIDFCSQQNETRHRSVSDNELDRLAGKNNAITTNYQTRWALTIIQGIYIKFQSKIPSKTP